ncbi:MAG: hypothetical protein Greene041619_107 [Candidatus Peregrinibacteria bacterium Greene0416_19]|nr:MAG: hypothetical protein Greene041619_107 [Candidatus Peregrinibacteria bacterium Greene0416_19]
MPKGSPGTVDFWLPADAIRGFRSLFSELGNRPECILSETPEDGGIAFVLKDDSIHGRQQLRRYVDAIAG